jgi:hypothetical protein
MVALTAGTCAAYCRNGDYDSLPQTPRRCAHSLARKTATRIANPSSCPFIEQGVRDLARLRTHQWITASCRTPFLCIRKSSDLVSAGTDPRRLGRPQYCATQFECADPAGTVN